jgi:hypothetical protein
MATREAAGYVASRRGLRSLRRGGGGVPQSIDSEAQKAFVEQIHDTLVGQVITTRRLQHAGIGVGSKGKWGQYNERLLGLDLNNRPLPDFGALGELKTTVRDRGGEFRESIKICMIGHDPLLKLGRIVLVIARDRNDSDRFEKREVRNEEVVVLEPTTVLRHALERDVQLLRKDPRSKETYFLETRTAGAKGSSTRAYYLKASRVQEYVESVPRTTAFRELRDRLRGRRITALQLAKAGYASGAKGKFGNYVRSLVPDVGELILRTGVVDAENEAKEDLLVCSEQEDPIESLRSVIYVPMRLVGAGEGTAECRVIVDVMYLAPTELALHALEYDKWLVKRRRGDEALMLLLKTHYAGGNQAWSWYIKKASVRLYSELLRNQPV